jgi:hypothetical protein
MIVPGEDLYNLHLLPLLLSDMGIDIDGLSWPTVYEHISRDLRDNAIAQIVQQEG